MFHKGFSTYMYYRVNNSFAYDHDLDPELNFNSLTTITIIIHICLGLIGLFITEFKTIVYRSIIAKCTVRDPKCDELYSTACCITIKANPN